MDKTEQAYEIAVCKRFLADPTRNPEDQNKKLLPGKGPYLSYIDLCRKHRFDVDRVINQNMKRKDDADVNNKRQTLRSRKTNNNLLSAVLLTARDFQEINDDPYEQFLGEVIAITNDNGGAIDRDYFDQKAFWKANISIAIPFKYTSKRSGADYVGFDKVGGLTNGELLYNLAPLIKSASVEYIYFQGLSSQNDGTYKLELTYEGW